MLTITENKFTVIHIYLKQYETAGVDAKLVEKSLVINFSFQSISIVNPYHLTALVKDIKSDNYIHVKSIFKLK